MPKNYYDPPIDLVRNVVEGSEAKDEFDYEDLGWSCALSNEDRKVVFTVTENHCVIDFFDGDNLVKEDFMLWQDDDPEFERPALSMPVVYDFLSMK